MAGKCLQNTPSWKIEKKQVCSIRVWYKVWKGDVRRSVEGSGPGSPAMKVTAISVLNLRSHCKLPLDRKYPFVEKNCYWHKNFSFFHFQSTLFNLPKSRPLSSQQQKTMQHILIESNHFNYFRNNFLLQKLTQINFPLNRRNSIPHPSYSS